VGPVSDLPGRLFFFQIIQLRGFLILLDKKNQCLMFELKISKQGTLYGASQKKHSFNLSAKIMLLHTSRNSFLLASKSLIYLPK
jgi:hypothetical protein